MKRFMFYPAILIVGLVVLLMGKYEQGLAGDLMPALREVPALATQESKALPESALPENSGNEEAILQAEELCPPIAKEQAYDVVIRAGINPADICFFDLVPFELAEKGDFQSAWVAVVLQGEELLGTFVDALTGELLAKLTPLPEGLETHLIALGIKEGGPQTMGRDQYENYPWGYDLPTNWGNHALTCGYGCGYHNGQDIYAVDLDTYDRECVPAPGSGYVMYAGGNRTTGYGLQVIIRGLPLGNDTYYIYRIAHFDEIWVVPGWWVDKNRTLGLAGSTGWSNGSHVHFSIHRGRYVGNGSISGGSLPLDRWPGPNDRVDYFDRYQYWQFSFNVCR